MRYTYPEKAVQLKKIMARFMRPRLKKRSGRVTPTGPPRFLRHSAQLFFRRRVRN
jgi:hypothetical protein